MSAPQASAPNSHTNRLKNSDFVTIKRLYHPSARRSTEHPPFTCKFQFAARIAPSRLSNYCQILEDSFKISGTLDAVTPMGRQRIKRYESDKSLKYLNTELEYAALNNATSSAGDAGTARQMKGMEGFIATNDKSYASYAVGNDFSEAKLLEMFQACYEAGGEPSMILVGPVQARKIANWNQAGRITVNT
ncbi:MAG: DUF5309 family protein [Acidobacteriota bacterium]